MSVRVAVVDIGTNSTRLLIADVEDGRVRDELERRTTVTRLGAGVDADGRLRDDAMQRVYDTLDEYHALIERHDSTSGVAVLTSAVRDAANGPEFAATVRDRYGLEPHVLSGDQEAGLTFLGATSERDPDDRPRRWSSTSAAARPSWSSAAAQRPTSTSPRRPGVVRHDRAPSHYRPADRGGAATRSRATSASILADGVPEERRRAVEARHRCGRNGDVAGARSRRSSIRTTRRRSTATCLGRRARPDPPTSSPACRSRSAGEVPGLDPERAPTIVAGAIILTEVMTLFGLEEIEISEHDILRGARSLGLA